MSEPEAPNGEHDERDSAEIALSDGEKLALLWRIIQGDPSGESGRSTGLAQLSRETHGMVGVVLRTLREQDVAIAELQRESAERRRLLEEILRRLPPPRLPDGVASTPPPKGEADG